MHGFGLLSLCVHDSTYRVAPKSLAMCWDLLTTLASGLLNIEHLLWHVSVVPVAPTKFTYMPGHWNHHNIFRSSFTYLAPLDNVKRRFGLQVQSLGQRIRPSGTVISQNSTDPKLCNSCKLRCSIAWFWRTLNLQKRSGTILQGATST